MRADIITVGDELLIGQTVNTNASWIGEAFGLVGLDVRRVITVGDDEADMFAALEASLPVAHLTVVTGGLGPTHDDLTRQVIAAFFKTELVFDERLFNIVKERFVRRGRTVPESNRTQAMIPIGFEMLPNPMGTAPGFWKMIGTASSPRYLAVIPGVPREMRMMIDDQVIPRFRSVFELPVITHRMIHTTGIGESHLQELLEGVERELGRYVTLAYLPSLEGVKLRLTVRSRDAALAAREIERVSAYVLERAGTYAYSDAGESLEQAVGRLLKASGYTVSVAESCTGGRVLDRLTNVAGSSAYVKGGVVAYCNSVKENVLDVSAVCIESDGAVSETVARQMARGVREKFASTIGLASTGILGPTGGSSEKPVGTVWIAISDQAGEQSKLLKFGTDRESNKRRAVAAVLDLLRQRMGECGFADLS